MQTEQTSKLLRTILAISIEGAPIIAFWAIPFWVLFSGPKFQTVGVITSYLDIFPFFISILWNKEPLHASITEDPLALSISFKDIFYETNIRKNFHFLNLKA